MLAFVGEHYLYLAAGSALCFMAGLGFVSIFENLNQRRR